MRRFCSVAYFTRFRACRLPEILTNGLIYYPLSFKALTLAAGLVSLKLQTAHAAPKYGHGGRIMKRYLALLLALVMLLSLAACTKAPAQTLRTSRLPKRPEPPKQRPNRRLSSLQQRAERSSLSGTPQLVSTHSLKIRGEMCSACIRTWFLTVL